MLFACVIFRFKLFQFDLYLWEYWPPLCPYCLASSVSSFFFFFFRFLERASDGGDDASARERFIGSCGRLSKYLPKPCRMPLFALWRGTERSQQIFVVSLWQLLLTTTTNKYNITRRRQQCLYVVIVIAECNKGAHHQEK